MKPPGQPGSGVQPVAVSCVPLAGMGFGKRGVVDLDARRAVHAQRIEVLSATEAAFLAWLARTPSRAVRREELLAEVWGWTGDPATRTIDAAVARLRKKIERDPTRPESILSVYGVGYRLELEEAPTTQEIPSGLLGRDEAWTALTRTLRAGARAIWVDGEPGIGKTALVNAFASATDAPIVSLEGTRSAEEVVARVARTLGLRPGEYPDLVARASVLLGRRTVILDDAAGREAGVAVLLAETVASYVVVAPGEAADRLVLGPLDPRAASLLGPAHPVRDRLAGNPLCLRLAQAFPAEFDALDARLDRAEALLGVVSPTPLVVDWAWGNLGAAADGLARSAVRLGYQLQLPGLDEFFTRGRLPGLVRERALLALEVSPGRTSALEAWVDDAIATRDDVNLVAAIRALRRAMPTLAERAARALDPVDLSASVVEEVAAVAGAGWRAGSAPGRRLLDAARSVGGEAGIEALQAALSALEADEDLSGAARAREALGELLLDLDRPEDALIEFERALAAHAAQGGRADCARLRARLGWVHAVEGRWAEAEDLLLLPLGELAPAERAELLPKLAVVRLGRGAWRRAEEALTEALSLLPEGEAREDARALRAIALAELGEITAVADHASDTAAVARAWVGASQGAPWRPPDGLGRLTHLRPLMRAARRRHERHRG